MKQMPEKHFLSGSQSEEQNSGQSLLYRYQREMVGTGDSVHQGYQCTDWTVNQNNEVLKFEVPLMESYQNQNDNIELSYHSDEIKGKTASHSKTITQNASEILRTVIQNELKNNKTNAFKRDTSCSTDFNCGSKSKSKDNSCSYQNGSATKSKNMHSNCDQYFEADDQKEITSPEISCENLKLQVTNIHRKKRDKPSILAGSLSLNNLDELLLEEEEDNDLIVQRRISNRKSCNVKVRNGYQNDPNSSDEREVRFLISLLQY
jgi:hypothetical protein